MINKSSTSKFILFCICFTMHILCFSKPKDIVNIELVLTDMAIVGEEGLLYIQKFERADVYLNLRNCGDIPTESMELKIETGPYTIVERFSLGRNIPALEPGESEPIWFSLNSILSPADHRKMEVTILLATEELTYEGRIEIEFLRDYNNDPDNLNDDCDTPKLLLQHQDVTPLAIAPSPTDITPLVSPEVDHYGYEEMLSHRRAKYNYGLFTLAAGGTGVYFAVSANNLYTDYNNATVNATDLQRQIKTQDRIWQGAFILSATMLAATISRHVREKRASRQISLSPYVGSQGKGLTMKIDL